MKKGILKEKLNEKKQKLKNSFEENRGFIYTIGGITVTAVLSLVVASKFENKFSKKDALIDKISESMQSWEEKSKENWDEKRDREKWNRVNEFAETLELLPNEEYWICGPDTYTLGKDVEIAHMINGYGSYPPEEADEHSGVSPLGD